VKPQQSKFARQQSGKASQSPSKTFTEEVAEWKRARHGLNLGGLKIRELIEEGRR